MCERADTGIVAVIDDDADRLERELANNAAITSGEFAFGPVHLDAPLPLETVRIEKPWGAEFWYTGIEQRGVCRAAGVPLPWLVELGGESLLGVDDASPILLSRSSAPRPEPVYGDTCILRRREEKIEVYVVTDIDETAWPNGTGWDPIRIRRPVYRPIRLVRGIQTGVRPDKVTEYRAIRDRIDAAFDARRAAEGLAPGDVVPPATVESWKRDLDPGLNEAEERLRAEMNAFTRMEPLVAGRLSCAYRHSPRTRYNTASV
ncbi:MAG: hypothetical protein U5O39_09310 [Gammaproteobacteria bacterium]|nr:hypothetical protein [Gammaproteobacteria bacterium]